MAGFELSFNEECHIDFHWYVDKDSKKLKWHDLAGPEKLVLFSTIKISQLLQHFEKSNQIQKLWDDFMLIYDILQLQDITEILNDLAKFKTQLCDWMNLCFYLCIKQSM